MAIIPSERTSAPVATKPKRTPSYDLKAADRRRSLLIQIGLTGVVVAFAVALVVYIVSNGQSKVKAGEIKSILVTSEKLIKKEDGQPKAVLSLYEDFLCPHCGGFEKKFGETVNKLIDTGAVAANYYMVALPTLDRIGQGYSSRAGGAAYCVADESVDAFRRFHAALYAQQPSETADSFPDNSRLIETARQAGVVGKVPDCVNSGKYNKMVAGLVEATQITSTPTVRINGQDFVYDEQTPPDALVAKVKEIVGDVPGLPAPAPPPPAAPPPSPAPAPTPVP